MKNPKTFLLLSVIVGVLLLGVAYAAIQNIELTVSGTATATPDQANFQVKFSEKTTTSGAGTITAEKTGDLTAKMTVTGLKKVGDTATATFRIVNYSSDLSAAISHKTTHSNGEYFDVTTSFQVYEYGFQRDGDVLGVADTTEGILTITVSLHSLPIEKDVTDNITVTVTASPMEPIS